jgi:hypothetical protein
MKKDALPMLALGATALIVYLKLKAPNVRDMAQPGASEPLRGGVPYLFVVRLAPGVSEDQIRATIESKGGIAIVFGPASVRPAWATPSDVLGDRAVSFKVTPQGNATVKLGDPFYGVGRLEAIVRTDGQVFRAD